VHNLSQTVHPEKAVAEGLRGSRLLKEAQTVERLGVAQAQPGKEKRV